MIRVHVICEGQTEEMFVKEVLSDVFSDDQIYLSPSLIGRPGHQGGNFRFERVLTDVRHRLLNDRGAYCTTFFDFYGLPESFPGKMEAVSLATISQKREIVERRLKEKLAEHIGPAAMSRFIPYVQMYEFEGLLFSQPAAIASEVGETWLRGDFESIRQEFETPEDINNSPSTAPSKRIQSIFSGYDKVTHGSLIALEIGIATIQRECSQFGSWVEALKALDVI